MPPKFQSSFIPKAAPTSGGATVAYSGARVRVERDIFSLLAVSIFTISLLMALGAYGYSFFLNYRIGQMGAELEQARATLAPETVSELVDLNSRLVSTDTLIKRHRIISPVFKFLEASTPKSVRYSDFNFSLTNNGLQLSLRGAATNYSALAVAAEAFNRNAYFQGPVFSDLSLDEKGRVMFSVRAVIDPQMFSYTRLVDSLGAGATKSLPAPIPVVATSTSKTATTTAPKLPPTLSTSTPRF